MNHYAAALAQLQVQPDHQIKQIGDQWQTPKPLAWGLFHHFAPTLGPVVLDMFADDSNALVPNYYTASDNALTQELAADLRRLGGAAFANPPYSRPCVDEEGQPITGMDAILTFCREQREQGARIMMLIKAATSETWWPEDADFIQFIAGRIGFNTPDWYNPRDPKKDKPSSSGFASAVVIFDASWQGERRPIARLRRDDLITTGTIILDMINRQALELTLAAKQTIEITAKTQQDHIADVSKMVQAELHIQDAELHTHQAYADADLIMGKCFEYILLSDEQQAKVKDHVDGWISEGCPLSEIYYRLELAVTNLQARHPIHQGFIMDGRTPSLPHWQRHQAVKEIIYQIDDADILTPAKTAELAAWIIDNLTTDGDLLALATAKAAELLAQSAGQPSAVPDHTEQQIELLDGMGQEPDAHQQAEEPSTKPLEDWAFDYQNDQLNLGGAEWPRFVAVLTVLYGIKDHYTAREVAIAISVSDEQLMDEYTTLDEEVKVLLRQAVSLLKQVEGFNFTETCPVLDPHRQEAVIALLNALDKEPDLSPITQRSVMINAITRMYEVTA